MPAGARQLGYSADWARTIVHRYRDLGPDGLKDQRHANPGATPRISAEVRAELQRRLTDPSADGGVWTGPKVAIWLSQRVGRPVAPQRAQAT